VSKITYKDAGVDIEKGNQAIKQINPTEISFGDVSDLNILNTFAMNWSINMHLSLNN